MLYNIIIFKNRSMAMFRFIHNPNGIKDNGFPRIAYWNFGYRVEKAAKYAGYGTLTIEQLFLNAKKDILFVFFPFFLQNQILTEMERSFYFTSL